MPRVMKRVAALSTVLTAGTLLAVCSGLRWLLPLCITLGTVAYHFGMRLLVGWCYDRLMQNRADWTHPWFRQRAFEPKLYEWLRVKTWKAKLPTYEPALFDPRCRSWREIAQAMCQSELVHETIAVLSFLPVAASIWLGELPVFLITSLLAAGIDLAFVLIQRYNRPTAIRLALREEKRKKLKNDEKSP